jgi:hypothetical protein
MRDFDIPLVVYVAVGVIVLWCKTSKANRSIYGLSPIFALIFRNERVKSIVELIVFLTIGCLISMGLVVPSTPAQAVAAGLGWTGFMTK